MTSVLASDERARMLHLELETLWLLDGDGRIIRSTADDVPHEPLLVIAAHPEALAWAMSARVPPALVDDLDVAIARGERRDVIGWAPAGATEILEILQRADLGALAPPMGGPSWRVPSALRLQGSHAELRTSDDLDVDALRGRMPERDRQLTRPWVVALVDGEVAAVCESARRTERSVEAGVWTYEPHRRRGLAAAVTAAWSELVADRAAFYSTFWDNRASQAVARHLALEPLGHWWQVFRREPMG
jgi:RimJ/RimL family protein N-acetyltransferase